MLLLGHLGTTVCAVNIIEKLVRNIRKDKLKLSIDYRFIMIGSMLPDIIDKPLILLTASEPVGVAKFIAHSSVFIIVLLLIGGGYNLIYKRQGIILMACAGIAHMLEDSIWRFPQSFFWPYYNQILIYKESRPTMNVIDISKRIGSIIESVTKLNMKKMFLESEVLVLQIFVVMLILFLFLILLSNRNLIRFPRMARKSLQSDRFIIHVLIFIISSLMIIAYLLLEGLNKRIEIITIYITNINIEKELVKPHVLVPEIFGGFIILFFFLKLVINKNLVHFLRTGLIESTEQSSLK
jgi:hypothetical protein